MRKMFTELREKGELPVARDTLIYINSVVDGEVHLNCTRHAGIDGSDVFDLTRAEIEAHLQIPKLVECLRKHMPGFENARLTQIYPFLGVRETRHFKGLYTVNEWDILKKEVFEDWIVKGAEFNFDVHNMTGASLDATGAQAKFPQNTKYTIPYRCCIPEKIHGMLLAGRNISGTHMAHSNYRVMPICVAMGEGVGIAAALAVKNGVDVRDVDAKDIQKYL